MKSLEGTRWKLGARGEAIAKAQERDPGGSEQCGGKLWCSGCFQKAEQEVLLRDWMGAGGERRQRESRKNLRALLMPTEGWVS